MGALSTTPAWRLLLLVVLATLLPSPLRRLWVSLLGWRPDFSLSFGATITSAFGEIFTKATEFDGLGSKEETRILAVVVGVRWTVRGWFEVISAAGFGTARICESKFSSKKLACSSITTEN